MTNEEIRALSLEDLEGAVEDEKERLHRLRVSHAVTPIENPMEIRNKRRLVARLMTELNRKKNSNEAS